uniref:Uncharacterized protein n=2 Tax=Panicoideae TaxID=147369 RepID=B4FGZ3_MAIZE|nr:unknown [Zea mays]
MEEATNGATSQE